MGSTYAPTYYTSLHDSITSICKNILPFSFKKRRIPAIAAAEERLSKQQSDNLKWQQESFHQILKLMGLCKEGILEENEVSDFRKHLIETITVAAIDYEAPVITRDKLIFLQELFYAKCITEDEYHASKKPLLRSLESQGAMIRECDVIVDLKEKNQCFENSDSLKSIKRDPTTRVMGNELTCSTENPFWNRENDSETKSILKVEGLSEASVKAEKGKKKPPIWSLFRRDQKENNPASEDKETPTAVKRTNVLNGFKKWKKNDTENETSPLSLAEKSEDCRIEDRQNTRNTKKNILQDPSQPIVFVNDEVQKATIGENVKREHRKEVEGHTFKGKQDSKRWITFDDEENTHPNHFAPECDLYNSMKHDKFTMPSMNARTSFNPFSEM